MPIKKLVCAIFGHKWDMCEVQYREKSKPIRRSSVLNRKGGKKQTLFLNSFRIKTEKCWYCKRCGKTK